jgi:hypothetical protein
MQIALVGGQRHKAAPGLSGVCPSCGSPMVPKCGERRVWHWAHGGVRHCDHWWEPETEWHRGWKNRFPVDWQEVRHIAENGEKHIADVKTSYGCVIEFQHSYLRPEERRAREEFYKPMAWVVNGLRLKRDKTSFHKALSEGQLVGLKPMVFRVPTDRCALLRNWAESRVAVFFDFGVVQGYDLLRVPVLWQLSPKKLNGEALLSPIPVAHFVKAFVSGLPLRGMHVKISARVLDGLPPQPPRRSTGFEHYMARKHRMRSLSRF